MDKDNFSRRDFLGLVGLLGFDLIISGTDYNRHIRDSDDENEKSEKYHKLAGQSSNLGNWKKASEYDRKAYEMFPDNPTYNFSLAYSLDKQRRFREAIPHWAKYLNLIKKNFQVRKMNKELIVRKNLIRWANYRLRIAKEQVKENHKKK